MPEDIKWLMEDEYDGITETEIIQEYAAWLTVKDGIKHFEDAKKAGTITAHGTRHGEPIYFWTETLKILPEILPKMFPEVVLKDHPVVTDPPRIVAD